MNAADVEALSALHRWMRDLVGQLDRLSQIPPDTGDVPAHEAMSRLRSEMDRLSRALGHTAELYTRRIYVSRGFAYEDNPRHVRHAPNQYLSKPPESKDIEPGATVVRFDMDGTRGPRDVPERSGVWGSNRQREGRSTRAK